MKAVRYHGGGMIRVETVSRPSPGPQEARVGVAVAGICGTDAMVVAGSYEPDRLPITLGHEFVGVVEEVGDEVEGLRLGTRVVAEASWRCETCPACLAGAPCASPVGLGRAVDGCFATEVVVPAQALHAVPDEVPDRAAQAFVSVGTALKAATLALQRDPDRAMIIGSGHGALLILQILVGEGVSVTVAGTRSHRLALARRFRAAGTHDLRDRDALKRFVSTSERGGMADVTIEATGAGAGLGYALGATTSGGVIVAYSIYRDSDLVPNLNLLYQRGLTLVASRGAATFWDRSMRLLADGRIDPIPLTRDPVGLEEVPGAFTAISAKSIDDPRVLIDPRINPPMPDRRDP